MPISRMKSQSFATPAQNINEIVNYCEIIFTGLIDTIIVQSVIDVQSVCYSIKIPFRHPCFTDIIINSARQFELIHLILDTTQTQYLTVFIDPKKKFKLNLAKSEIKSLHDLLLTKLAPYMLQKAIKYNREATEATLANMRFFNSYNTITPEPFNVQAIEKQITEYSKLLEHTETFADQNQILLNLSQVLSQNKNPTIYHYQTQLQEVIVVDSGCCAIS